jgi:hypothetical protein
MSYKCGKQIINLSNMRYMQIKKKYEINIYDTNYNIKFKKKPSTTIMFNSSIEAINEFNKIKKIIKDLNNS